MATGAGFPHIWIKNTSIARAADGEIKVGVLFSLTGTTAIIEESLNKATILAIEEINAAGGINGMKIVPVVEEAGVRMAIGSDIRPLKDAALLEMGLWVKDGATPWQTLILAPST